MLHFSKLKTALIWAVCALFSLPNFLKPVTLPDWMLSPRLSLGLDLQGGPHPAVPGREAAAAGAGGRGT